jgi:hypothetical protein
MPRVTSDTAEATSSRCDLILVKRSSMVVLMGFRGVPIELMEFLTLTVEPVQEPRQLVLVRLGAVWASRHDLFRELVNDPTEIPTASLVGDRRCQHYSGSL